MKLNFFLRKKNKKAKKYANNIIYLRPKNDKRTKKELFPDGRYHFIGEWANGDHIVISIPGKSKSDAWYKILKARKDGKFKHRQGDNFYMKYLTNEEDPTFSGHCYYVMDDKGDVHTN